MRRKPAEWMVQADERILELLTIGGERLWLPPKAIYMNLDVGNNWVHKRLGVLLETGLVERESGAYRISDDGMDYLAGDLNAAEIDYARD